MTAKGYQELQQFVRGYTTSALESDHRPPDLELSLSHLRSHPETSEWLARLGSAPRCLIEGYVSPRNGAAVRRFLASCGVAQPRIEAFDLFDVGSLYRSLGWDAPDVPLRIADACHLQSHFADGSVDLLIQDFLLNCAPLADHVSILREAARVLRRDGLLIISFTDARCLTSAPRIAPDHMRSAYGFTWSASAYNLSDAAGMEHSRALLPLLGGSAVGSDLEEGATWICRQTGRFEFFRSHSQTCDLLRRAGFSPLVHCRSSGFDNHGLHCERHHCLYRLARDPGSPLDRLS